MLRLYTDTDCDMTPAKCAEYGYTLISMPYSMDGETEVFPYEDWEEFDHHAFYQSLRDGVLPTTSAISKDRYTAYFEPAFAAGDDILYVHFSAAMSTTQQVAAEAARELAEKYPGRRYYTIDTKGISIICYEICCEIGQMYKDGATVEQLLSWAEKEVDRFAIYFFADDLKFFKRSGRVGGLAATMGTLIGIRPIIYVGEDGKMCSIGKEKGRGKALARLMQYVEDLGDDICSHKVMLATCDNDELVQMLKEMLIEKYGDGLDIEINQVNPTIGAHCGPDAVGICFHAKHR